MSLVGTSSLIIVYNLTTFSEAVVEEWVEN